jgi:Ubinuclein conserved middle domain
VKVKIKKLQAAVKQIMPEIERKYTEEVNQYEIKKASGENVTELKMPKRRFHWNDQCRLHLKEVTDALDEFLKVLKIKKELEEFKTKYLKDNVVTAWPESWMKIEDLQKELKRKEKKENRLLPQNITTATNGTKVTQQKTELRLKTDPEAPTCLNGTTGTKLSPPLPPVSPSVIKKSSDHSINSIMSTSPSPPTTSQHSSKIPKEGSTKVRQSDVDKVLNSADLVLSAIKNDSLINVPVAKALPTANASVEKSIRISDGSDSDCTIVESSSPIKITTKPQSQQFSHINNNNNNTPSKLNHSPTSQQQQLPQQQQQQSQPSEVKKSKKQDDNYSSLIKNIVSLTVNRYII